MSPEQIRGVFRLKQAEIQALIEGEQARLSRTEGRLRQIEGEGSWHHLPEDPGKKV